jgi:magnesium chelatase family protein
MRDEIHNEVPAVKYKELRGAGEIESSASVRERVMRARQIQLERYKGEKNLYANAQMPSRLIRTYCAISTEGRKVARNRDPAPGSLRPPARMTVSSKVARTIVDLEAAPAIEPKHLSEAIQYRTLDRTYWA